MHILKNDNCIYVCIIVINKTDKTIRESYFQKYSKLNLCSQLNALLCCYYYYYVVVIIIIMLLSLLLLRCCYYYCYCCHYYYYYYFRGNIRLWKRIKWEISIVLFLQREQCWERIRCCGPTFSIKSGALPIVCYWKIARTSPIRSSCHGNWKISLEISSSLLSLEIHMRYTTVMSRITDFFDSLQTS